MSDATARALANGMASTTISAWPAAHIVMRGHFRMTQGDHVIEAGPGDYIRWNGTIPHDAEAVGDEEGHLLIVTLLART